MRTHIDNIDEYITTEETVLNAFKMTHLQRFIKEINTELSSDTRKQFIEINNIKEFIYNNSNHKKLKVTT